MKKIISFTLYGNNPKYTNGLLCNIELSKIIYPDWICRIYYGTSVDIETINKIKSYNHCELFLMEEDESLVYPRIWRFFAIDDDDVEVMICRDADSRLSYREKKCVDIFLESNYLYHSIRDNVSHNDEMAGMIGIKKNDRAKIKDLVGENYRGNGVYDADQQFLRNDVVTKFSDSKLIHCSKYIGNFPVEQKNEFFVGGWWPSDNYGKPNDFVFF